MKLMNNNVLIRPVDEGDYVKLESGIKIYADATWKPEDFTQTFVEVIDVPDHLKMGVNALDWDTDIEIKPSDFAWVSMMPVLKAKEHGLVINGNILISYRNIYAKVSGKKDEILNKPIPIKKVVPVNGYGLYEPIEREKYKSDIIKILDNFNKETGRMGKVVNPGRPLKKYLKKCEVNINLKIGDIVVFEKTTHFKLEHEYRRRINFNKELWIDRRKNLLCLIHGTENNIQ